MSTKRIARLAAPTLAQLIGAVATELRRLNTGRLDSTELASMTPRDRRNAVKAALAAHHRNTSRCC
jgi:hypothetical protein